MADRLRTIGLSNYSQPIGANDGLTGPRFQQDIPLKFVNNPPDEVQGSTKYHCGEVIKSVQNMEVYIINNIISKYLTTSAIVSYDVSKM